jgi:hypothetical protein
MSTTTAAVGGPRRVLLSSPSYSDAQRAVEALSPWAGAPSASGVLLGAVLGGAPRPGSDARSGHRVPSLGQ